MGVGDSLSECPDFDTSPKPLIHVSVITNEIV